MTLTANILQRRKNSEKVASECLGCAGCVLDTIYMPISSFNPYTNTETRQKVEAE